jgi:hypothetical protein
MRRVLFWGIKTVSILTVAMVILGISIVHTSGAADFLALRGEKSAVLPGSPTPTPSLILETEYYLPYPGILPDHFLYPVKMSRDWVKQMSTRDKLAKADLYLLYADKRMNATKVLIEGNKIKLGVSTAGKAEKYLEKALVQGQKANAQREFWGKLKTAAQKHEELLMALGEKVAPELKPEWEKALGNARMVKDRAGQSLVESD